MSQVWLKPKKFSACSARSIVLYPHALSKRLRLLVTIAPKIFAAPIGVVWLPGWVPTNVFFSSGAAFLSLAPSSAKGYYATAKMAIYSFIWSCDIVFSY